MDESPSLGYSSAMESATKYAVTSASARINGQVKPLAINLIACSATLRPGSQNQRLYRADVFWDRNEDQMGFSHTGISFDLVFEGTSEHEYRPKRYTLVDFRPATGSYLSFKEEPLEG